MAIHPDVIMQEGNGLINDSRDDPDDASNLQHCLETERKAKWTRRKNCGSTAQ